MKTIASRDNALVKGVRALAHDARERRAQGRAWIEGEHLVRAWLDARRPIEHLVIASDALDMPALAACIARAHAQGLDPVALAPAVMRTISTLDDAPPIGAVVPIEATTLDAVRGRDVVALDGVQDPGNVGAVLRTAAAAGVQGAVLGPGCASPWSPKVLRAAMGAHVALAIVECDDLAAALATLGVPVLATVLDAEAASLYEVDLAQPVAWVFGHEGEGVSDAVKARVDRRVMIPQAATVESLNVAAAAAVCLFEARRQRVRG